MKNDSGNESEEANQQRGEKSMQQYETLEETLKPLQKNVKDGAAEGNPAPNEKDVVGAPAGVPD